jgi:hypothetical protein
MKRQKVSGKCEETSQYCYCSMVFEKQLVFDIKYSREIMMRFHRSDFLLTTLLLS